MSEPMDRREFLRTAGAAAAMAAMGEVAALLGGCARRVQAPAPAGHPPGPEGRRLIIVLFGGGTRSSETIDDPQHRWIPRLWGELVPRGTLLTNMRVLGKVVHPNSAGSIMTGHWEWDDIDWSHPVDHPTIFEVFRKGRRRPDTAAWAMVYASILANIGLSRAEGFGPAFAANVVEPPTIPRRTAEEMDRIMREAGAADPAAGVRAAAKAAELARAHSRIATGGLRSPEARRFLDRQYAAWKAAGDTTSHDAFLTAAAEAAMKRFAPEVLAVCYGEIDCAHYGSWSRYVEAIARTDGLTERLWRAAEDSPAYRGRTLMLILPDHGRELDRPGGSGFIHHSDFYTGAGADEGCRRVWMLALGPGVAAGRKVDAPVPITAVAATGLEFLGLPAPAGAEKSALPLVV